MSNTYDKSSVYFFVNNETGEKFLIGNKEELIKYITKFMSKRENRIYNPIFENFNVTGKDVKKISVPNGCYANIFGHFFPIYIEKSINRTFSVVDGLDRKIDVKMFSEEINDAFIKGGKDNFYSAYFLKKVVGRTPKKKKKGGPNTKSHNFVGYRTKSYYLQKLRENSEIESINKEFGTSFSKKDMHWKSRIVEGNWKSQYKVPSQHNVHNAGKDNKSIRRDFYPEEIFDVDTLLEEDFI